MGMTFGQVLYDQKIVSVVGYNGFTPLPGFVFENALDWFDYSMARILGAGRSVDVTGADTFDTVACIYSCPFGITLELGGTSLAALPPSNFWSIAWIEIPEQSFGFQAVNLRVINNGGPCLIRQLTVGNRMEFPIGQHAGVSPPTLGGSISVTNSIAINGAILGRSVRRKERSYRINVEPVTPEWVRSQWVSFTRHAERRAFFFRWSGDLYPSEVVFATADEVPPPRNITPTPRMSVQMPISCQAAEDYNP